MCLGSLKPQLSRPLKSTRMLLLRISVFSLIPLLVASLEISDSFAQNSDVKQDQEPVCICSCTYKKQQNIAVPGYFQSQNSSSCEQIEGLACLATHRGKSFVGFTSSCEVGARPLKLGQTQSL